MKHRLYFYNKDMWHVFETYGADWIHEAKKIGELLASLFPAVKIETWDENNKIVDTIPL